MVVRSRTKVPIRAPNGGLSPLAVCGSVLHHVVVLVKQGPLLHSLDFGPANGADVTANILEAAPPKKILATTDTRCSCSTTAAPVAADTAPAPGAAQDELPYMYLGAPAVVLEHPLLQQLVCFAESRPYHALTNNCIHFADAAVRLLTAGAVRGAPLLYDIKCGSVPAVDNPMLLMMQLMLRMPWFLVVDGSPLTAAFLEHLRAASKLVEQPKQVTDPHVATVDPENRNNNNNDVAVAAANDTASEAPGASAVGIAPPAGGSAAEGADGPCASALPASGEAAQGQDRGWMPELRDTRQGVAARREVSQEAQREERERRQEQENDQASRGDEAVRAS
ncbi:hypothetical protein PLESTF_000713400 [Pleodorina starrii]|nr:hypothetical protein PLESTF_000713400 [Pleodorina starrii]